MARRSVVLALLVAASSNAAIGLQAQEAPGGVRRVTNPIVIFEAMPWYTEDALRARVETVVEIEALVLPDGTVGNLRVMNPRDRLFGLEEQAILAVRKWRFEQVRDGIVPVPFIVTLPIEFKIHPGRWQLPDDDFTRGAHRDGQRGLVMPVPKVPARPRYTTEAMSRRIEGTVDVLAVVTPNGSVDRVKVMKSLDRVYGLDGEALSAVKRATFEPGMLNGTPVPVLVIYQVQFKLGKFE